MKHLLKILCAILPCHYEKASYFSAVDRRRLVFALNKMEFSDVPGVEHLFYEIMGRRDVV